MFLWKFQVLPAPTLDFCSSNMHCFFLPLLRLSLDMGCSPFLHLGTVLPLPRTGSKMPWMWNHPGAHQAGVLAHHTSLISGLIIYSVACLSAQELLQGRGRACLLSASLLPNPRAQWMFDEWLKERMFIIRKWLIKAPCISIAKRCFHQVSRLLSVSISRCPDSSWASEIQKSLQGIEERHFIC